MSDKENTESSGAEDVTESEEVHDEHGHDVGVEGEGVDAGTILGVVLGVVVIVTGLVVFAFTITEVTSRETQAQVIAEMGYPDLREARASAAALLTQYDVVNAEARTYRIPIDRAIDLLVNEHYSNRSESRYTNELNLSTR